MPVFVIFGLGQPARAAKIDATTVKVGRDPGCAINLPGDTVSREHASFVRGADGRWLIRCDSQKNPIVVDGAIVTSDAGVVEGTEVLIGSDHLIIFSEDEIVARSYMGGPLLTKSQCQKCQWTGLVSVIRRRALCPKCGSTSLTELELFKHDAVDDEGNTTSQMSDEQAKLYWKKLKEAKHSYLERMDDHEVSKSKKRLSEEQPTILGTETTAAMQLVGLSFGSVTVCWDGTHYVADSSMKFPAMKINGTKTDKSRLRNGDVLEVGSNRFRFTSE